MESLRGKMDLKTSKLEFPGPSLRKPDDLQITIDGDWERVLSARRQRERLDPQALKL